VENVKLNAQSKKKKNTEPLNPDVLIDRVDQLGRNMATARTSIGRCIYGQHDAIEESLITLLAGGHLLLIGVPGLGKTKLVETIGHVFGLNNRRVQFTPDLMPADILGAEVLEETEKGRRSFRFVKGPVFCQLLMADEINRASPRTQSALLQAMQEHRVSVAGEYHELPEPFHVLATQNPLEQEGTYPLPEAQLDRFLMQVDITYPDLEAEREILIKTTGTTDEIPEQVMDADALIEGQKLVRHVPTGESVAAAILDLVRAGRPETSDIEDVTQYVAWGPGPRASQALMLGVKARAVMGGRLSPSVDDVLALAHPVLRHRMALTFAARAEGVRLEKIIDTLCERIS
jgi:MoxR-like ATPase